MFTTPLSATGMFPATHYISSGLIEDQFASLLPLITVVRTDGTPTTNIQPGNVALTAQLAAEAGLPITEAEVAALLGGVDVSEQQPHEAMSRLGLQIVTEI